MPDQTTARPSERPPTINAAATARPQPSGVINPLRRPDEQRSLFGEILDWMLAPLLVMWPMSVTLTFLVAQGIANPPYDRKLAETVSLLVDHVELAHGTVQLKLGIDVSEVLRPDAAVTTSYMVLGLRGELVAGDTDIPLPVDEDHSPGPPRLRFDKMNGAEVRCLHLGAAG
jgi:two-component system sensor histidine kinase TctE